MKLQPLKMLLHTKTYMVIFKSLLVIILPVCKANSHVPSKGANVCPGLETSAAVPNINADTAFLRLCNTKSSSTKSLMTRFNNLHVPSVNTLLL